jgi:acetyltransferase-like isoleucine patch superfamily enzyme
MNGDPDNIFFRLDRLAYRGKNVIIGKTVRIRYPELVELGDNSIIDDFTYISTRLRVSPNAHIAAGCKLIGGRESTVKMGEYSTLAPNVVLSAGSDDYMGGIATPLVPPEYKGNYEVGTIEIGRHCIVGAGSVVLPNVTFSDGAALGALSLAKESLEAWTLYAGIPARRLKLRDRDGILELEARLHAAGK